MPWQRRAIAAGSARGRRRAAQDRLVGRIDLATASGRHRHSEGRAGHRTSARMTARVDDLCGSAHRDRRNSHAELGRCPIGDVDHGNPSRRTARSATVSAVTRAAHGEGRGHRDHDSVPFGGRAFQPSSTSLPRIHRASAPTLAVAAHSPRRQTPTDAPDVFKWPRQVRPNATRRPRSSSMCARLYSHGPCLFVRGGSHRFSPFRSRGRFSLDLIQS